MRWFPLSMLDARRTAVTLLLATAGGLAAAFAGLPAPWLSGAMVGASLGVAFRVDLHVPQGLRDVTFFVLGTSMGASVSPGTFDDIARWPVSLLVLVLVVAAIMVGVTWTLRRFGWDKETALFASAPGALSTVLVLASQGNANMPRVVISQSLRIFVLVAILPSLVALLDPSAAGAALVVPTPHAPGVLQGPLEYAAMLVAGLVGLALMRALGVPAPILFGAFLGSAVVHGSGLVAAPVPAAVLVPSFIILGAFIALRFKGTTWAALRADLAASVAALVVSVAVAFAGAVLVFRLLGIGLSEAIVAYAPGGLEAMIIMALALKLDVAYVSLHHLVRFLGIAVALPLIVRLVIGPRPAGNDT